MGTSDVSSKIQEHIANRNLISFRAMFSRASVPKISCRVIRTVRDFQRNRCFVFNHERKQENKFNHAFRYGKLKTKRKNKGIPQRRNKEVEKYERKVSTDLDEEQIVVAPSSIFDVNQYLKHENDKKRPLFDHAFAVRYTVEFFFF